MSHSSGINVSKSLSDTFGAAVQGDSTRLIKVQIEDKEDMPELIVMTKQDASGSFEDDLQNVTPLLEEKQACYVLYKMDESREDGKPYFLLFSYVPDKCKVRQKMVYASTRANLRKQLGTGNFKYEIHGTIPDDFSPKGYQQWLKMHLADVPLTEEEILKEEEEAGGIYMGGASTYIHGVAFPVEQRVMDALKQLDGGSINYVQMNIDPEAEKITLGASESLDASSLGSKVSPSEPGFHFFNWQHTHEGDSLTSLIFVYSCPDGSGGTKASPVKLRMLYSSSKANVEGIVKEAGMTIAGKLEVNRADEVNEEALRLEIHPPKREEKKKFARPKGPNRGGRRLIRKNRKK